MSLGSTSTSMSLETRSPRGKTVPRSHTPRCRMRENTALEKGVVDAVELEKLGQVRQPLAHEPIALALLIADLAQPAFDSLRHRQVLLAQPAVERACHPVQLKKAQDLVPVSAAQRGRRP